MHQVLCVREGEECIQHYGRKVAADFAWCIKCFAYGRVRNAYSIMGGRCAAVLAWCIKCFVYGRVRNAFSIWEEGMQLFSRGASSALCTGGCALCLKAGGASVQSAIGNLVSIAGLHILRYWEVGGCARCFGSWGGGIAVWF